MSALIWQYSYLQVLDFLSTIAFLLIGIEEGNPLVRLALHLAPTPIHGLAAIKLLAVGLGFYCSWMGKTRLLARINVLFALVVVWNMVAVIFGVAKVGLPNPL